METNSPTSKSSHTKRSAAIGSRNLEQFLKDADTPSQWSLYGGVTSAELVFLAALPDPQKVTGLKPKNIYEASFRAGQHQAWKELSGNLELLDTASLLGADRLKLSLPAWSITAPAPQSVIANRDPLPDGAYPEYRPYQLHTYFLDRISPEVFAIVGNWCHRHGITGLGPFGSLIDLSQRLQRAVEAAVANQQFVMFSRCEFLAALHFDEIRSQWNQILPEGSKSYSKFVRATGRTGETIGIDPYDLPEWIAVPDISSSLVTQTLALFRLSPELLLLSRGHAGFFDDSCGHPISTQLHQGKMLALTALSFVCRVVALWSAKQLEGKTALSLSRDRSLAAMQRRSNTSGLLTLLSATRAGRPHSEANAILLKEVGNPTPANANGAHQVQARLAVMLPEVAMLTEKQRTKSSPTPANRYLTLPQILQTPSPLSPNSFWPETQAIVPQGHFWNAVALFRSVIENPADFCNFSVFIDGHQTVNETTAATLGKKANPAARTPYSKIEDLLPYFAGAHPTAVAPGKLFSRHSYHSNYLYETNQPKELTRIVEANLAEVHLETRFRLKDGNVADASMVSIAKLLGNLTQGSSDEIREDFRRIEFLPEVILMVNGKELSEADWISAKLIEGQGYRIPATGQLVAIAEYQSKTDMLVLRKRVLKKFTTVRLGDIWRLQNTLFRETAAERALLSPEAYLRDLILQVDPVFSRIDALAPVMPKTEGQENLKSFELMRAYQQEGVLWAYRRLLCGFGVCFADEMGLGKTLQAIGLMQLLRRADTRMLVAAPKTLVTNWQREINHFAPELRVATMTNDRWTPDSLPDCDVVLTTYPRLRLEAEKFAKMNWRMVVLDEAHTIKNSHTKVAKAVTGLAADFRVALTGTPIENHPRELWSLMDWLNQGMLGNLGDFVEYTEFARTGAQRHLMLEPLRRALSTFILRRMKCDPKVALNLPPKIHKNHVFGLAEGQIKIYREVLRVTLEDSTLASSVFERRSFFLKALLHLKQLCNHPTLFFGKQSVAEVAETFETVSGNRRKSKLNNLLSDHMTLAPQFADACAKLDQLCAESTKLEVFRDLMLTLREEARGILIFTQYLATAALLQRVLRLMDEASYGGVPLLAGHLSILQRQELIDSFHLRCSQVLASREGGQGRSAPILILSLKTGGMGLNLTGADHVVHFDRWWNPAVEDQATDRAHRIGQDRSVMVHNLTSEGTIEEAIATMFGKKRQLAEDLLGGGDISLMQESFKDSEGFLNLTDPQRWFTTAAHKSAEVRQ